MALGKVLERVRIDDTKLQPWNGPAEQRKAPGGHRVVVGILDDDRLGDSVTFEHDPVDGVAHHAPPAGWERPGDGHLGHPEGGKDRPRPETVGLRSSDKGIHRIGVDRLGPRQGQRQRREVETLRPT